MRVWGAWLLLLISPMAWATDPCERALARPDAIQAELERLPPLPLDLPTVREGVRKLIRGLTPLHGDFSDLQKINEDLAAGRLPPELAREAMREMRESIEDRASEALGNWDGRTRAGRELLEGYKILMKRLQASASLADSLENKDTRLQESAEEPPTTQEPLRQLAKKELAREASRTPATQRSPEEPMSAEEFARRMNEAAERFEKRPRSEPQKMPSAAEQTAQREMQERLKREPVPEAEQKVMEKMLREAQEKRKEQQEKLKAEARKNPKKTDNKEKGAPEKQPGEKKIAEPG